MIVECTTCEARVDAEILSSYDYWDAEQGPPGMYFFLRCHGCKSPFLAVREQTGPDAWDEPVRLYPALDTRVNPALPPGIRNAFSEAIASFRAKAYTAAAIMCRKTLEGVCVAHGVANKSLVAGLRDMKERSIIESRLYDWADALRIAGNEAAHDVAVTVSKEDARDIVEFTNALLEYVFTFRDKFEAFRKRRQKVGAS